jgi:hypothetical protein
MPAPLARRPSFVVVCVALLVVTADMAIVELRVPGLYHAIAAVQLAIVCLAAWKLGAREILSGAEPRRTLACAGALLVLPWMLLALLPGVGRPDQASLADNETRYVCLIVNAAAVGIGMVVLREALREAGERFHSTLGMAAALIATPLYLVWGSILHQLCIASERAGGEALPAGTIPLSQLSDTLLFLGGALTYVATAAFALSLGRLGWIGRAATRTFVALNLVALACLVVRGMRFPDPKVAFVHAYTIPGWVVGIPAVPWMMPCVIGALLLRRAGEQRT